MSELPRTPPGSEDSFVLKCPGDGHDMESVLAGNFTIDRCLKCGGLWFDMAELQRMIAHGMPAEKFDTFPANKHRKPPHRPMECPRDQSALKEVPDPLQPHIKYHQCQECGGLFLHAGDLKDLTEYTFTERLRTFFRF